MAARSPRAISRWCLRHRWTMTLPVAAALAASAVLVASADRDRDRAAAATTQSERTPQVELDIPSLSGGLVVPRSFLGISTEYWALPIYERHPKLFERALSLFHVHGDGPLIVRIGGNSADHAFVEPGSLVGPRWVFPVTPKFLSRTATIIRATKSRVIINLNLATGSPAEAAQLAQAAKRRLPHGSILAFEVGNEPDVFDRSFRPGALFNGTHPRRQTPLKYAGEFTSYGRAVERIAPGSALAAPALASPLRDLGWITTLLASPHQRLGLITAHSYLLSGCARPSSVLYPTIARLLNDHALTKWGRGIAKIAALAHTAGFAFRITELNSIDCGGFPGVSDTFANALWAPDALFHLLAAGVDGVNLHLRAHPINAPFVFTDGKLQARPALYGIVLFARTIAPGAQLLHLNLAATRPVKLTAWAVRLRDGMVRVMILNEDRRAAGVDLSIPGGGAATVQRLLAPLVTAGSGLTLAGQRLGPTGAWDGRRRIVPVRRTAHEYQLTVPATSAALVTAQPSGL
jgi:hypothetical protein